MKSLMLKSLTITALLSSSLVADKISNSTSIENKVLKWEKRRIERNPNLKLNSIDLYFKKELKHNNWYGYVFDISIDVNGKTQEIKDIVFSDGFMITPELQHLKNGLPFKKMMYPKLSFKYYDDKFLIAGDKNAKHKVTIFSDPLCPICIDVVPEIIKDIQDNSKNLALYYIPMPLDMHPTARLLVKAVELAKKEGVKNIDYKVYTANFEKDFHPYKEKDDAKVLKIFNKKFGTNITMKDINNKHLEDEVKYSLQLASEALVQGTPTMFFDGDIDTMRNKYKKYLK